LLHKAAFLKNDGRNVTKMGAMAKMFLPRKLCKRALMKRLFKFTVDMANNEGFSVENFIGNFQSFVPIGEGTT